MGATALRVPEPGETIAGKYRVVRLVASGGMGAIVEAEHAALGQRVAIKILLPEAGAQPELVERFLREARAAARLQSDHVVRVFDIGTDSGGAPFMVMELLAGVDLADELAARGRLPVSEAVDYVLEALDAIAEAHAAGIVHRDLKPSNLFLVTKSDGSRRVKVLDFGISKIAADRAAPDAALTSTKSMLGSPGYMSPEQVRSTKSVDARTDVWALGVILYELLTGQPAFSGETLGDIFAKIREEDLPPIRSIRPDVPEELAAVLTECLQRDRDKRLHDAVMLRSRLQPFAAARASRAILVDPLPRAHVESAATIAAPARSGAEVEPTRLAGETLATWSEERGGKRRGALVLGGVLAAAVGGLGLLSVVGRGVPVAPAQASASSPKPAASARTEASPSPAPAALAASALTPSATAPSVTPAEPTSTSHVGAAPSAARPLPEPRHVVASPPAHVPTVTPARPATAASTAPPPPKGKKEDLGI